MWDMAQEIVDGKYNRSLILDHIPILPEPNKQVPVAYSMGYLRAMFDRLYDERKH